MVSLGGGLFLVSEVPLYPCIEDPLAALSTKCVYRGTSLIRNRRPLGTYSTTMPRALWGSSGGGHFLMSEVPR